MSRICAADCAPTVACADGSSCAGNGQCTSAGGFASTGGGGGNVDGGSILPDGGFCADTDVQLAKTEPYVLFLLDQSSSMTFYKVGSDTQASDNCSALDCRWQALKDALIGRTAGSGLIHDLQGSAQMAVALFSATDNTPGSVSFLGSSVKNPDMVCPRFNGKAFAGLAFSDSNYSSVDNLLRPANVDNDTPTGEAIQAVVGIGSNGGASDPRGFALTNAGTAPKVLVLVTDGEAGYCVNATTSEPDPDPIGTQRVLTAVASAYKLQIPTYVIALGGPSQATNFKEIANTGQGKDPNTGDATAISPTDTASLKTALSTIVTNARSCIFALNGTVVTGQESRGSVIINGTSVPFGTAWHLASPTSIELLGDACNTVKTDPTATLSARFPCDVVSIGVK